MKLPFSVLQVEVTCSASIDCWMASPRQPQVMRSGKWPTLLYRGGQAPCTEVVGGGRSRRRWRPESSSHANNPGLRKKTIRSFLSFHIIF